MITHSYMNITNPPPPPEDLFLRIKYIQLLYSNINVTLELNLFAMFYHSVFVSNFLNASSESAMALIREQI